MTQADSMNATTVTMSTAIKRQPCPLRALPPLDPDSFGEIRRRMILDACKWDPQVEDISTLSNFPLLLDQKSWLEIARAAEALAREAIAAEREIAVNPKLLKRISLPREIRNQ